MKSRKKYRIGLILWMLFFFGFLACDTANNIEHPDTHYFVKYYGGDGNQQGVDLLALGDGSFLLLGNYSESAFDTDVYLVRVDAQGEVIWEKRFGRELLNNKMNARDLEPTNDGNFIVLSDFQSTDNLMQVKLRKISADGTLLDSADFGTPADDFSRTATLISDGGFIVSGVTDSTDQWSAADQGQDPGNTFSYRLDQNLDRFPVNDWSPVIRGFGSQEGAQLDVAIRTVQRADTVFYVFGYTNSVIAGDKNPNGRLGLYYFNRGRSGSVGTVAYPGNIVNVDDTEINFVQPVDLSIGGGFLIIGTSQNTLGISEIFVARVRGTLVFEDPLKNDATLYKTISVGGRNIRGVSATSATAGAAGFIILGNEVRSIGPTNIWVSKIDQSGIVQWSSTFGSEAEEDFAAAVAELPDGKIVILGTMGLADNQSKMAFIKVNPTGQLLK